MKKRIGVCGSPGFTLKFFEAVRQEQRFEIDFAITNIPKLANKMKLEPTAVDVWATQHGIDCFRIDKIKGCDHGELESRIQNVDCVLIFAFGKIIPQYWLDLPAKGWLNIHPSKLPKWRGPTPIQYAILNDDFESALTLMKINAQMDEGDLIAQYDFRINESHNYKAVMNEISAFGPQWMCEKMALYLDEAIEPFVQKGDATYSHLISKNDYCVQPGETAEQIVARIKAFGYVLLEINGELVKCFAAQMADESSLLNVHGIAPIFLQRPGKKMMHVRNFVNGVR